MRPLLAAIALLAALLAGEAAIAQGTQGGVIEGTVQNATTGRPAAGARVSLLLIGGQGPEEAGRTTGDATGRFRFKGLQQGRYLVRVEHGGIPYASHAVVGEGGRAELVVKVYERSGRVGLRVVLLGVAVDAFPGYLRISEVVHLGNPSNLTFSGRVALPLPRGARYLTFVEGLHRPTVDGDTLIDDLVVRPGGHQLAYGYSVGGAGEIPLDRRWEIPIDRIEVLVSPPAEARSPHLQPGLPVSAEDRSYRRASGAAVAPGILSLGIVGVPRARLWIAPAAAAALAGALAAGLAWAAAREVRP